MLDPRALLLAIWLLAGPPLLQAEEVLRDPTRPDYGRAATGAEKPEFSVTAIFVFDDRRIAVVNGKRVVEGDQVDGARVVEISPDALRLEFRGKAITARLLNTRLRNR